MMIGRRSVLRAFAALGLGGKSVANEAMKATTTIFAQSGITVAAGTALPYGARGRPPVSISSAEHHIKAVEQAQKMVAKVAQVKLIGIPDFLRKEWRDYSIPDTIDVDIACMVSVSPVYKRHMQHRRNMEDRERSWSEWPTDRLKRALWNQATDDDQY